MMQSKMKSILASAMFVMAVSGITTAHGQYVVTGTTAGGGNVVVGNGLLDPIVSDEGFLTATGSDHLTLNLGSFIPSGFAPAGASVAFDTPNNTFVNNGTIQGADETDSLTLGVGVSFLSNDLGEENLDSDTITNEIVVNNGTISGAESDDDEIVGSGLSFFATGEINGVKITNTGFIFGASNSFDAFLSGNAVSIVSDDSDVTNITLLNSGSLIGGSENDDAIVMSSGIAILGGNGISNVSITNTVGGNIIGGNDNDNFGEDGDTIAAGNGIAILDENEEGADIDTVTVTNSGNIMGGNENSAGGEEFDNESFLFGNGIGIAGLGDVSNINIINSTTGVIQGGQDNDGGGEEEDGGWFVGNGVSIGAVSNDEEDADNTLTNVTISNAGTIIGGNDNFDGEFVGSGVAIYGNGLVSNVTINNFSSGVIRGGDDNFEADETVGGGINIASFGEESGISGVTINNWGLISGGSGNGEAFLVGVGIGLDSESISNVTINNNLGGTISGGTGNSDESFETGSGIIVDAETIDGLTINNKGLIVGGSDFSGDLEQIQVQDIDGEGGDGIDIFADNISNVTINNGSTGVISGGLGGGAGIVIDGGIDPSNVVINNLGSILGGDGDIFNENEDGGTAIVFESPEENANIVINNFGYINGGNGAGGGNGGEAIFIDGNNTTTNNWGVIAAGKNSLEETSFIPLEEGPNNAIVIEGSGNVLNLNGHSEVLGKITVSGPENSNVVNLNFTGLTPAQLNALTPILAAQGVNSGSDSASVIFTVRGVTYDIDPAIVNGHLTSYQIQGGSPNPSAVGASLDSATTNPPPGSPLFNLLNGVDVSGNIPNALQQLSPQPYQIYGDIALANANFNTLEIDHRLNNLRDGSEGIDTTGIGGDNSVALTSGLSKDDGKDAKDKVIHQASEEKRWGFFASGNAIFTNIDARDGLQKSGFTTAGMLMGLDGKVNEHWLLGTFFDYEHTDADLDNQGSTAKVESYGGGVYAGYHDGGYYGNGLLAYTRNNYDSKRNIFLPGFNNTADASTAGNQFEANIDGGYDIHLNDRVTWGPILGLQYVHLDVDGFNENGAPAANLALGSQDLDSLRSRLGFRIDYHKQVGKHMAFATEARAEWQHEFLDDSRALSASFIGDGLAPFSVQTSKPQRDAALAGVGVNLTVRDKYTFFFDYDVQAGQESYLEQSVKGGIKISW